MREYVVDWDCLVGDVRDDRDRLGEICSIGAALRRLSMDWELNEMAAEKAYCVRVGSSASAASLSEIASSSESSCDGFARFRGDRGRRS